MGLKDLGQKVSNNFFVKEAKDYASKTGKVIYEPIKDWSQNVKTQFTTDASGNSVSLAEGIKSNLKGFISKGLDQLVPTTLPLAVQRILISRILWGSEHNWDVAFEGLKGVFRAYCPANQASFELCNIGVGTESVGGYAFAFPEGVQPTTCSMTFQDDEYCSLAITFAEWMSDLAGLNASGSYEGFLPLSKAGREIRFRMLTNSKTEVTAFKLLVIPNGVVPIDCGQQAKPRDIQVHFTVLGTEILSSGLTRIIDLVNRTGYGTTTGLTNLIGDALDRAIR